MYPPARTLFFSLMLLPLLTTGCGRDAGTGHADAPDADAAHAPVDAGAPPEPVAVPDATVEAGPARPRWEPPTPRIDVDEQDTAHAQAQAALEQARLFEDEHAALPVYLALLEHDPDDAEALAGVQRVRGLLLQAGNAALAESDEDAGALGQVGIIAAVLHTTWPDDEQVEQWLLQADRAQQLWQLNERAEHALDQGRLGESGGGALAALREALELAPEQARALQNLAAVESALIRRAETAALDDDFVTAAQWLDHAAGLRPDVETVADARERLEAARAARIVALRDLGLSALAEYGGMASARGILSDLLRITTEDDPAVEELRERIFLTTHYGQYRPGQVFSDGLQAGFSGPEMVVVPHGEFTMGAPAGEPGASEQERPQRRIRFERGFAMSVTGITVAEFRRFVETSGYQSRAMRRGFSMVYDERAGNFVRRSNVDWRSDYLGAPAADEMPVMHVSVEDAEAYARWLSQQSGRRYRLPSEAEYEYVLRAGGQGRFPWGELSTPPQGAGNLTGELDVSPGGRNWSNAFPGYGDGYWGPSPAGHFEPNAWGVHDLAGNLNEWVADCWHESYRRAPRDASAWVNPGCRMYVIRGGAWASSPEHTRSAWRAPAQRTTTNARIGLRVVREL